MPMSINDLIVAIRNDDPNNVKNVLKENPDWISSLHVEGEKEVSLFYLALERKDILNFLLQFGVGYIEEQIVKDNNVNQGKYYYALGVYLYLTEQASLALSVFKKSYEFFTKNIKDLELDSTCVYMLAIVRLQNELLLNPDNAKEVQRDASIKLLHSTTLALYNDDSERDRILAYRDLASIQEQQILDFIELLDLRSAIGKLEMSHKTLKDACAVFKRIEVINSTDVKIQAEIKDRLALNKKLSDECFKIMEIIFKNLDNKDFLNLEIIFQGSGKEISLLPRFYSTPKEIEIDELDDSDDCIQADVAWACLRLFGVRPDKRTYLANSENKVTFRK